MRKTQRTWTSLVLEVLRARAASVDCFMDYRMLKSSTGANVCQVAAALCHLRRVRAVDVIVNADGHGWWYALPPDEDRRSRAVEERVPESKPRRRRRLKPV